MKTLKQSSGILLPIIILLLLAIVPVDASNASRLLDEARQAIKAAKAPGSTSSDIGDNYKKSIGAYSEVMKKYPESPEGVTAMLELADVYTTGTGKHKNLYLAYETLKKLLNANGDDLVKLTTKLQDKNNLDPAEAQREARVISDVVRQAKINKKDVMEKLDEESSHKIQYKVMDFLVNLTGRRAGLSYWLAIVMLTLIVKVLITPLTKAQFQAAKEMQKVAPLIKELQAKHKGDQKTIGEKTMALYKEHKINPFASCLPLLIQMPILLLLYYTIRSYEFQFANGTFLWIGSTAKHLFEIPVPFTAGQTVFIPALNLAEPDLILVVLYLVSMVISMKMSNVDPSQAEQQKMMTFMMPVMFAFMFAGFPSAFLLYWLVFNILQTTQQYMIMHSGEKSSAMEAAIATESPKPASTSPRARRRKN